MTETEMKQRYDNIPKIMPDNEAFGEMLCCAVRYGLGRRSYVTSSISRYVTRLIPYLTTKTLQCIESDITKRAEMCQLGDGIDAQSWLSLRIDIIRELKSRKCI